MAMVALVLGLANLLADGFSMAISNYEAIQAQREYVEGAAQFLSSLGIAALMFFLIGMLKSLIYQRPLLQSGLRTLLMGGAAAGLAFLAGHVAHAVFGVGGA